MWMERSGKRFIIGRPRQFSAQCLRTRTSSRTPSPTHMHPLPLSSTHTERERESFCHYKAKDRTHTHTHAQSEREREIPETGSSISFCGIFHRLWVHNHKLRQHTHMHMWTALTAVCVSLFTQLPLILILLHPMHNSVSTLTYSGENLL